MADAQYDIVIVGGGIVGLATGMALLERENGRSSNGLSRVAVLEAEREVGAHQTGHNSGVIHSGLYYKPGSLKARNCVEGKELLYRFCEEHGVAYERCGKIVVATRESELPALAEIERRGAANGLDGVKRIGPEEIREREPHARGVAGLWVPQTGIVDFPGVARTYAREIAARGGEVRLGERFLQTRRFGDGLTVETSRGELHCRRLINCAGLRSDLVAKACGVEPGLQIVPFRGEYYELRPGRRSLVRNLIYPVPDSRFPFLGVHFTRMVKGGVEAGPNAVLAFEREGYRKSDISLKDMARFAGYGGFWRMARRYWKTGMGEMWRSYSKAAFVRALQALIPEIQADDIERAGAGVRAQAVGADGLLVDDFRIVRGGGMIHVLNAPSPAATASISIGRAIAGMAAEDFG